MKTSARAKIPGTKNDRRNNTSKKMAALKKNTAKTDVSAVRGLQGALGLKGETVPQVIARINAGFPYSALDSFQKSTALPMEIIAGLVRVPSRTLTRRKAEGRLRPDESERLFRVARVVEKAVDLFEGDRVSAIRWMQTPQPALDGHKPLDFAQTEVGGREVEDLIGRLEHGVFT